MFRCFFPIVVVIIGSYYGYQWYPFLPACASIGISCLIYMLAVQLHFGSVEFSLNVFSGIALLMCLYAIMQVTDLFCFEQ
jgi:hypothetical protein